MYKNDTIPSGEMDQAFSSGDTIFSCQMASNIASIMNMLVYNDPDMYEDPEISTESKLETYLSGARLCRIDCQSILCIRE